MKENLQALSFLVCLLLTGCNRGGDPGGIDGSYLQSDAPAISLTIKDGRYWRGSAEAHTEGTYTVRQRDADTFELKVTLLNGELRGIKHTVIVKRNGNFILVNEGGHETKFRRS